MNEDWYYGLGEENRGPISFEALLSALRERPDWRDIQVWCSDFDHWRAAKDVPRIAFQIGQRPRAETPPTAALPATSSDKRMFWIGGAAGLAGLALAAGVAVALWRPFTSPLEGAFVRIIESTRPALPRRADESTSLMDVTSSGTRLVYQHVWDGPRFAIPANLGALMRARKLADICAAAQEIFKLGGSVEYTYRSQSALFIASFEVTKQDCG